MEDETNPQVLALAAKRALAKARKVKELSISPDMTDKQMDALVTKLAKAKAEDNVMSNDDWKTYVKGQRWYCEDLQRFSAMSPTEMKEYELNQAFPDLCSESELEDELKAIMSA